MNSLNDQLPFRRGFRWLMAGLLCILLDIPVKGWWVPPDIVGYMLLVVGLGLLTELGPRMTKARIFALVMVGLSVLELTAAKKALLIRSISLGDRVFTYGVGPDKFFPWTLVNDVLLILIIWQICSAIYEHATALGDEGFARQAVDRRNLYLILFIVQSFVLCLSLLMPGLYPFFTLLMFIFGLVVLILLMNLMRQAGELPAQAPPTKR